MSFLCCEYLYWGANEINRDYDLSIVHRCGFICVPQSMWSIKLMLLYIPTICHPAKPCNRVTVRCDLSWSHYKFIRCYNRVCMQPPNQDEPCSYQYFLKYLLTICKSLLWVVSKNISWIILPHFHLKTIIITQLRAGHQTCCPFQEGFGTSTTSGSWIHHGLSVCLHPISNFSLFLNVRMAIVGCNNWEEWFLEIFKSAVLGTQVWTWVHHQKHPNWPRLADLGWTSCFLFLHRQKTGTKSQMSRLFGGKDSDWSV